jgi:hypothetical protein
MTSQIVTGNESDVVAATNEENVAKITWDALTDEQREQRIRESHAAFDLACSTVGHSPFWK